MVGIVVHHSRWQLLSARTKMGLKDKVSGLMPSRVTNISWLAFVQSVGPPVLVCAVLVWAALHFVSSAPPHTLTVSSGPKGSNFEAIAQRYSKILARSGIKLIVIPSEGSLDNLNRMSNPKSHVDIALVQSGLTSGTDSENEDLES